MTDSLTVFECECGWRGLGAPADGSDHRVRPVSYRRVEDGEPTFKALRERLVDALHMLDVMTEAPDA